MESYPKTGILLGSSRWDGRSVGGAEAEPTSRIRSPRSVWSIPAHELTKEAGTTNLDQGVLDVSAPVRDALDDGQPVVALESTIISHGLPRPDNLRVAKELESIIRANGAEPATIAVIDGRARIGIADDELERLSFDTGVRKLGMRDLPLALAIGATGSTTVSATAHLASLGGIRVFATGGIGGVHRGWQDSWDESADLDALSRTPITIVSAGVKSVLDVPASIERLETLSVTVLGYLTDEFPGFYLHSSGHALDWRVDSPEEVVAVMRAETALGLNGAIIVANPVGDEFALPVALHDRVLEDALAAAETEHVHGKDITPFLLERMVRGTGGAALDANLAAVRGNCAVAAEIACAWSKHVGEGGAMHAPVASVRPSAPVGARNAGAAE